MTNTTNQMTVTLKDHMGSDLSVVNAARVSFAKESDWVAVPIAVTGDGVELFGDELSERDAKLIQYLAKHNHWTPFGHTSVTLHIKAPIFIARQLGKHQVGLVWNEVSRRYVDDEPEFYVPEAWRARPEDGIKQGSSDETIPLESVKLGLMSWGEYATEIGYTSLLADTHDLYSNLLKAGVAPEMARMVLPQSMMTEWYWTGSIAAWARVYKLRNEETAQKEAQVIAQGVSDVMSKLYPVAWEALTNC